MPNPHTTPEPVPAYATSQPMKDLAKFLRKNADRWAALHEERRQADAAGDEAPMAA